MNRFEIETLEPYVMTNPSTERSCGPLDTRRDPGIADSKYEGGGKITAQWSHALILRAILQDVQT